MLRSVAVAILLALALSVANAACADVISSLTFTFEPLPGGRPGGAVNANGARCMTVAGGWEAASAAKAAAEMLQSLVMEGTRAEAIKVEKAEGGYAVTAGDRRIILVDEAMAAAMKSTRDALAEEWAESIRTALSSPYLALAVESHIVPLGERRTFAVKGNFQQVSVTANTHVVQAQFDAEARTLSVVGMAAGDTQVVLDAGAAKVTLLVKVMRYAGRIAPTAEAVVTGRIAPVSVIKQAASAAIQYSIDIEPGAWAEVSDVLVNTPNIAPGQAATVTMRVELQGPNYLPVQGAPQVRVLNEAIAPTAAKVLMVSNRPERLPSYGLWYEGRVPSGYPARLLYHHVNATRANGELAVELTNTSDHAVRVQIVEAKGGPSRDEVFAGHKAARDFLQRQADDIGYVVTIPAGASYTAAAQVIKPGEVISGLLEMRVMGDGQLRVGVRLRPPSSDLMVPVAQMPPERSSTWIFSDPHKELSAQYRVGSSWAFATIGDKQVLSSTGRELLDGDYGVFYDIKFEVENPTDQPAHVELALMPGGGLARGIVMIDGQIYETGLLRYGEAQRIYSLTIPAQGKRELRVRTMPEAGSNYPVKLVMRPRGAWD
jgi:hypothetical protein